MCVCVCVCVCMRSVVPDSCIPMDCSPLGSSVHGIFQARILKQVAISSSSESSQPRDQTHISCISCIGRFFTTEPPEKPQTLLYHAIIKLGFACRLLPLNYNLLKVKCLKFLLILKVHYYQNTDYRG